MKEQADGRAAPHPAGPLFFALKTIQSLGGSPGYVRNRRDETKGQADARTTKWQDGAAFKARPVQREGERITD